MGDSYKIITQDSEGLYKEKGSKFICYLRYADSREAIDTVLNDIKLLHPKGRHHCYAYVLGKKYDVAVANDDGEPSGSAGRPILGQLKSFGLTNCIAIVVRYFGGTKLGIPGLINAYKVSTKEAIQANEIDLKTISSLVQIQTNYAEMGKLMNILKKYDLTIVDKNFDSGVDVTLEVRSKDLDHQLNTLKALLLGLDPKEYDGSFDPPGFSFTVTEPSN